MIEILLAGEFRTGNLCADAWRRIDNVRISIFTDIASKDIASESYKESRVVVDDYMWRSSTRNMFERWKSFLEVSNIEDTTTILISRPDYYIFNIENVLETIKSNPDRIVGSFDDNIKTATDTIFALPAIQFKRLVTEYESFNNNELEFLPHEYLYYFFKKYNALNSSHSACIYRPTVPPNSIINYQMLKHYNTLFMKDAGRL